MNEVCTIFPVGCSFFLGLFSLPRSFVGFSGEVINFSVSGAGRVGVHRTSFGLTSRENQRSTAYFEGENVALLVTVYC